MPKIYESPDGGKTIKSREIKEPKRKIKYVRNEDKILKEIADYVDSTYGAHYSSDIQVTDIWDSMGIAKEAYRSNIVKYAIRAGKKGDQERKDIIKIIHYALMYLNEMDKDG